MITWSFAFARRGLVFTAVVLALLSLVPPPDVPANPEWQKVECQTEDGVQVCRRCEYLSNSFHCVIQGVFQPDQPPRYYWSSWKLIGPCDGSLWTSFEVSSGVLFKRTLYRQENGQREFVRSQNECVDDASDQAWKKLKRAITDLPGPEFNRSPHRFGVTQLQTGLWYEQTARLSPITAAITRPDGIRYQVAGRAWIRSITWDMSDTQVRKTFTSYPGSNTVYGSSDRWLTEHTFRASARRAGHTSGEYPIRITVSWAGQYRTNMGNGWSPWLPVGNAHQVSGTFRYPVREIASVLGPVEK